MYYGTITSIDPDRGIATIQPDDELPDIQLALAEFGDELAQALKPQKRIAFDVKVDRLGTITPINPKAICPRGYTTSVSRYSYSRDLKSGVRMSY